MMHTPKKPREERHGFGVFRRAFTFFEILVAVIFLMTALVYLFTLMVSSNRGTIDSYRETIAYELANEGLEWVAGMGFRGLINTLKTSSNSLDAKLGLAAYREVTDFTCDDGAQTQYSDDYKLFERCVELTPSTIENMVKEKMVLVKVKVRLKKGFFRKNVIVLEKLLGSD